MKLNTFIFKRKPIKNLTFGVYKISGRNNTKQIVLYHRCNILKKKYKFIDFIKYIYNVQAIILRIEYDSKRTALLNLIIYYNGILCYTPCVKNIRVGDIIFFKDSNYLTLGCTSFLKNIQSQHYICLLELYYKCGAQYFRAVGAFSRLLLKKGSYCFVKLKSKTVLKLYFLNIATIGIILGFNNKFIKYKKASFYIYRGWKPIVRGIAMNPVDHPHGGGGGKISVSKWGKITKGPKTRLQYSFNNFKGNIKGYL